MAFMMEYLLLRLYCAPSKHPLGIAQTAEPGLVKGQNLAPVHVPQPICGDPERIMLWAQVITGLEVDELTAVRFLDAKTWQQRRDRLQKLGGRPVP
jgi:hypothetical protein